MADESIEAMFDNTTYFDLIDAALDAVTKRLETYPLVVDRVASTLLSVSLRRDGPKPCLTTIGNVRDLGWALKQVGDNMMFAYDPPVTMKFQNTIRHAIVMFRATEKRGAVAIVLHPDYAQYLNDDEATEMSLARYVSREAPRYPGFFLM